MIPLSEKPSNKLLLAFIFALVVIPRLPLVIKSTIHYDSGGFLYSFRHFLERGYYTPDRHPGSPLAELPLSALYMLGESLHLPGHYFSNSLSLLATIFTFFFIYKIALTWLRPKAALVALIFLNFHPQMFLFGGATSDMPLLLFFMSASLYSRMQNRILLSILLAWAGCYCRIQGLALLLPLLGLWALEKETAKRIFLSGLVLLLVMTPGLIHFGFGVFFPGKFHAYTITSTQKLIAAIYRSLNVMGPIGSILVGTLFIKKCPSSGFRTLLIKNIYFWTALLNLAIFRFAPMEAYYLLPAVIISLFFWFINYKELISYKFIHVAFLISFVLSNAVQLRLRPWKRSLIEIYPGTIEAQNKNLLVIRGGG